MRGARCICATDGSCEAERDGGKLSGGQIVYSYLRADGWPAVAAWRTVGIASNAVQAPGTNVRSGRFYW